MLALTMMTSLQMLVGLGLIQLAAPHLTTTVFVDNRPSPCFKESDLGDSVPWEVCNAKAHNISLGLNVTAPCSQIPCPPQGPFSMARSLKKCPLLLTNGLINIFYYIGEAILYAEPLGLVLLVLASLSSSFLIPPLQSIMAIARSNNPKPLVIALGIIGAILCVLEKPGKEGRQHHSLSLAEDPLMVRDDEDESAVRLVDLGDKGKDESAKKTDLVKLMASVLRVSLPFFLLAITYALYFVIQVFFSDNCRTNAFSYNAIDQVLLPLYTFPFIAITALVPQLRFLTTSPAEREETLVQALRATLREIFAGWGGGFLDLFLYRGLINTRAVAYSFLVIKYDVALVFLELTLIRVLLSWLGALVLVWGVPVFIKATKEERLALMNPINMALKAAGSAAIVGALVLLNKK